MIIQCPCCQAKLTVDPATGDILLHEAASKAPVVELSKIKEKFKDEARQREETFQKSIDEQKRKSEILKNKFTEAFKKARENPDKKPPLRDIDL